MRRLRRASLVAAAAFLLVGCGGDHAPRLARSDAAPLIALAQRVEKERGCGQRRDIQTLQSRAIALINRHRVPDALQEPFLSHVNALASVPTACNPDAGASARARTLERWLRESSR
jgi:hypothetical protein